MRIQRRVIKKRYKNKTYESIVYFIGIPTKFNPIFEKLHDEGWEFDVNIDDAGSTIRLLLQGQFCRELVLKDIDLKLASEQKLEISLEVIEPEELQKIRSGYYGGYSIILPSEKKGPGSSQDTPLWPP